MRIKKINHVNEFLQAIEKCKHDVWLTSPYGDKYNLKSAFLNILLLPHFLVIMTMNLNYGMIVKMTNSISLISLIIIQK